MLMLISLLSLIPLANAYCNVKQVQPGDGCWAIANRCGIDQDTVRRLNQGICDNPPVGKRYCCNYDPDGLPPATQPNQDGTCKTHMVGSGQGCWDIANLYKLDSFNDIETFNNGQWYWNGCSKMQAGDVICVSTGKAPPDPRPKQQPNGDCYSYTMANGDTCDAVARKHKISVDEIERHNKDTFHWKGCARIDVNARVCLSPGNPPLPLPDPNQQCGLASVGPNGERNLTCALNACCSTWGFCGTTTEFCEVKPNYNGCQSNCAIGYNKNSESRNPQLRIGYFESWNEERPCGRMSIEQIPNIYSHIHFAFAFISSSFQVEIDAKTMPVFEKFMNHKSSYKKVLSFGGWAFNDPGPTQSRFTEMVHNHRSTFIASVINFINRYKLDGVDFDWEYPGAPDRGGRFGDADAYLAFVRELRSALPNSISLSIAAPASLWYLREFKIAEMSQYLDYIVYMTYDIHGQWDYAIKWTGPYLKSHVNWTETMDALAMITKAGVQSNKVLLGIGYYGRSFRQVDPNCYGPECLFQFTPANPGKCTGTGGYLSMDEINMIERKRYVGFDPVSRSTIMTFDDDQWIAYTDESENLWRRNEAIKLGLGGTVEWAVDLNTNIDSNGVSTAINIDIDAACKAVWPDSLDSIPQDSICSEDMILKYMYSNLYQKLDEYDNMVNKGSYDYYFSIYQTYMKRVTTMRLKTFMAKNANKYFKCKVLIKRHCCQTGCWMCGVDDTCSNDRGCGSNGWYDSLCPNNVPMEPERSNNIMNEYQYTLVNADSFYNDLANEENIVREWVEFDDLNVWVDSICGMGPCRSSNWYGFPKASRDFHLPNPRELVDAMGDRMYDMLFFMKQSMLLASDVTPANVVDGTMLQFASVKSSIESMSSIVEKGNEIRKEQEKELILNLVSGVIMFLPVAGQGVAALSRTLANVIRGFAITLDIGKSVYEAVSEPSQLAFMGILFSVLGNIPIAGQIADDRAMSKAFKDASDLKRSLGQDKLSSLGTKAKSEIDNFSKRRGPC